jgi:hypothetical protein
MVDNNPHRVAVDVWVERAAAGLSAAQTLENFDEAFGALWRRTSCTLGEVTLMAIADRVLLDAAEKFPMLSQLEVDPTGLRSEQLQAQAATLDQTGVVEASRFLLTEFMTVLGDLVANVLTPSLHAELAKVTLAQASRRNMATEDQSRSRPDKVEKS